MNDRTTRIRCEHDTVNLIVGGKSVYERPINWKQALELAAAIKQVALRAEENAKADRVIMDGAILTRGGVNIGLTSDPRKMAEIAKEAAWNTTLRKQLRPMQGVASSTVVSTPSVMMGDAFDSLPLTGKAEILRRRYPGLKIQER